MRFCSNCGKQLGENAAFCTGCGASAGNVSVTSNVNPADKAAPAASLPATQGTYRQPNTQGGYYAPNGQGGPSGPYQNTPYGSGPGYQPGGSRKNNKTTVIIVSVIIGLALIGGGIFAYLKLSDRDNASLSSSSIVEEDEKDEEDEEDEEDIDSDTGPSEEPAVAADSSETVIDATSGATLVFDASTQDNIIAACKEIGMDFSQVTGVYHYGTWYEGDVYTFMYNGSVIDLLLYDDDTVFSIETGGVQVYLSGYESYLIDDYTGATTHFDESYPSNGYVFYMNREEVDSTVTFDTSYDYDYVIELVNQSDFSLAIAFYVQAGMLMSIDVPEGDYIIQYAAGSDWQGVDYLFGPETVFYRSDSIYSFYPGNESTITLDISGGTGIPSSEITIDDF